MITRLTFWLIRHRSGIRRYASINGNHGLWESSRLFIIWYFLTIALVIVSILFFTI